VGGPEKRDESAVLALRGLVEGGCRIPARHERIFRESYVLAECESAALKLW
jgi:hypothetical protein